MVESRVPDVRRRELTAGAAAVKLSPRRDVSCACASKRQHLDGRDATRAPAPHTQYCSVIRLRRAGYTAAQRPTDVLPRKLEAYR